MSYKTMAILADDRAVQARVAACAATFGIPNPSAWAMGHAWQLAATEGWDAAYGAAVSAGVGDIGDDESVITDAMILAAVQQIREVTV